MASLQHALRRGSRRTGRGCGSLTALHRQVFLPLDTTESGNYVQGIRFASVLTTKSGHLTVKGTGGRSSVSGVVATVFGATGFLGRYVVQQLAKMGSQLMIPYRGLEDNPRHLKLMGDLGQIVPMRCNIRDDESIKAAIANSNIVINLIGRDYETRNFGFEEVNVGIAERIARLSQEHGGISRYVQVSCLGASESSPSKLLRTKFMGETATQTRFPAATIIRPAPLFGTEDRFLNRWAIFAKRYPYVPIVGSGETKLQPVNVMDVGAAIVAVVKDHDGTSVGKVFELGGPDVFTINELVHKVFEVIRDNPRTIHIFEPIAQMLAAPREFLYKKLPVPLSPFYPFYKDYIEALKVDQVVSPSSLGFESLGVQPRALKGIAVEYLYAYRQGGPSVGKTVGETTAGAGY